MIAPDVLARLQDPALDARIASALAEDATSVDVSRLLPEVEAAANAADAAAEEARARALDPLLSRDDVKVARREMDDAAFVRDRLHEAGKRLGERVEDLKAVEADRRMWAEHERVLAERDRLAEEMERMAEPIVKIAHTVSRIAFAITRSGGSTQHRRRSSAISAACCRERRPLLRSCLGTPSSGMRSSRSRGCRRRQLFPAGQVRRTSCASSDQPVRQRRFSRGRMDRGTVTRGRSTPCSAGVDVKQ